MKIYVTRHGETTYNVENRISGISDVPLTKKGEKQALSVSMNLKDKKIDLIIASPLLRARQTAKIIQEMIDCPIIIDKRLHEIDFGIFEGKKSPNQDFLYCKANHAMKYPGGEKLFEVVYRVYDLLHEIEEKYNDKTILLVCHGGIVRVIHSYFHDMTNEELMTWLPENCCIQEYEKIID